MKFTQSKDGEPRVTIQVKVRLSRTDLQCIAYVTDKRNLVDDPKLRVAKRSEAVAAVLEGFSYNIDWGHESAEEFFERYDPTTQTLAPMRSEESEE